MIAAAAVSARPGLARSAATASGTLDVNQAGAGAVNPAETVDPLRATATLALPPPTARPAATAAETCSWGYGGRGHRSRLRFRRVSGLRCGLRVRHREGDGIELIVGRIRAG